MRSRLLQMLYVLTDSSDNSAVGGGDEIAGENLTVF